MNILVADDEEDIRNLVKISLEENGYTVLTAQNGKEAWDILAAQDVHLAILDVMMPVMDGFNLLRKIREHSTIPRHLPDSEDGRDGQGAGTWAGCG